MGTNDGTPPDGLSGIWPEANWSTWTSVTPGVHTAYVRFTSDDTESYSGFSVDWIGVCSSLSAPSTATRTIAPQVRNKGVLLGTEDTVYFRLPAGSDHFTVAMWADSELNDFDLYARCGSRPNGQNDAARSFKSGSDEFLHLDGSACPSGYYVAVNSYSNSGKRRGDAPLDQLVRVSDVDGRRLACSAESLGGRIERADGKVIEMPEIPGVRLRCPTIGRGVGQVEIAAGLTGSSQAPLATGRTLLVNLKRAACGPGCAHFGPAD